MKHKDELKRLISYLFTVKKQLSLGLVFVFIMTGLQLVSPLLIAKILDELVLDLDNPETIQKIVYIIIVYIVFGILIGILKYLSGIKLVETANLAIVKMRMDLYEHIQKLPMKFFDNMNSGKIVSRITNDTNRLKIFYQTLLSQIVTGVVYVLAAIIILLVKIPQGILLLVIPIPLLLIITYFYQKRVMVYRKEYRKGISQVNSDINENVKGLEIISSFGVEEGVFENFKENTQKTYEYGINIIKLENLLGSNMVEAFSNLNMFLIVLIFGLANLNNRPGFTVGTMYILLNYTSRVFNSIRDIIRRYSELVRSLASASHIFEIFDYQAEEDLEDTDFEFQGQVEFRDVYFYYKEDEYVLKDINFNVKKGETIALVGATGSGKSSIINLLYGFYRPVRGDILYDSHSFKNLSINDIRKNFAIVLQEPFIFEATLKENISLGRKFTDEEVIESLEKVGGKDLLKNFGNDINVKLSEGGTNLSQGEKQIITFARALITKPKVLILDEATSSIDSETELYIQETLEKIRGDKTVFIIAHRLSTIKNADKILVLEKGRIIEEGKHGELIKKNGFYRELYEL